jgi:hypothetical protein
MRRQKIMIDENKVKKRQSVLKGEARPDLQQFKKKFYEESKGKRFSANERKDEKLRGKTVESNLFFSDERLRVNRNLKSILAFEPRRATSVSDNHISNQISGIQIKQRRASQVNGYC